MTPQEIAAKLDVLFPDQGRTENPNLSVHMASFVQVISVLWPSLPLPLQHRINSIEENLQARKITFPLHLARPMPFDVDEE